MLLLSGCGAGTGVRERESADADSPFSPGSRGGVCGGELETQAS